ncbi:subtype A tannase [Granulicatella adiacens]
MKRISKRILIISGASVLLFACSPSTTNTMTTTSTGTTVSQSSLTQIDRTKWLYNETDNVYYQIGISYAGNQVDENQTLSIFIPGEYMTATSNGDGTYTADLKADAKIGDYTASTAPVVMPINTPGYSKMNALTEYTSEAATYTKEGFIYMSAGLRGRDTGAPNGVIDAKAAIRYLRSNTDYISSTNPFYVFGMSGGGAQSAIIGASGDSELYTSYLNEIGAVSTTSDAVDGVMAWCPITNLDVADAAYEWNLGSARTGLDSDSQSLSVNLATQFAEYINKLQLKDSDGNVLTLQSSTEGIYQSGTYYEYIKEVIETSLEHFLADTTFPYDASKSSNQGGPGGGGTPPSGEAPSGSAPSDSAPGNSSSSEQTTSTDNASAETTSIEQIDNVNRQQTSSGLSLTGTYNSVEEYIAALNTNKTWVTYDSTTKKVTITSVADFVSQLKSPSKSLTAFDALDESQAENQLFGSNGEGSHFDTILANLLKGTSYESAFTEDASTKDSQGNTVETRVQMYNPMYYLTSYYEGNKTSTVAKNWRIRTGINQGDTALSTEVNLALALQQYGGLTVDFETIWGQGHTQAERTGESSTNFINWVKENTK